MSCPPGSLKSPLARHMNWVVEEGGLPRYFERIACHLHFEKGMDIGHAVATAHNVSVMMCSTGDLEYPGLQNVNKASRAEACAAVARWEEMKARAHARGALKGSKGK